MSHPSDYQYYLDSGSQDISDSLGIQKMPEGYSLMLNPDQSHAFWIHRSTGVISSDHWSRWACYRGAKKHKESLNGAS